MVAFSNFFVAMQPICTTSHRTRRGENSLLINFSILALLLKIRRQAMEQEEKNKQNKLGLSCAKLSTAYASYPLALS